MSFLGHNQIISLSDEQSVLGREGYSVENKREDLEGSPSKSQNHTRWQCRLSAGVPGH